jgi:hypothetical protein
VSYSNLSSSAGLALLCLRLTVVVDVADVAASCFSELSRPAELLANLEENSS